MLNGLRVPVTSTVSPFGPLSLYLYWFNSPPCLYLSHPFSFTFSNILLPVILDMAMLYHSSLMLTICFARVLVYSLPDQTRLCYASKVGNKWFQCSGSENTLLIRKPKKLKSFVENTDKGEVVVVVVVVVAVARGRRRRKRKTTSTKITTTKITRKTTTRKREEHAVYL
ncbi:hypothetical protein ElyMa_004365900 [Elysia marginata]|uniref:Uncharacterized protein n=1 Tax=Elysia marginata TaxID=1093978 RepID=A0AAV4H4G7_9GAST|nr:hypothetical protein ElyMa_004365900 [Elysia marginata]